MTAEAMTSTDIRAALRRRWPDDQYLTIDEAPDGPDRMGRKVDLVAISLWRSRGYQIDAVEIKVSVGDWMREVNQAGKADFWWHHSHRFWVAVPSQIVLKVRETLPETWGLIAVSSAGTTKVAVQAKRHDAEPLTWMQSIGLLRAAANAGVGALARAHAAGYSEGHERARTESERKGGDDRLREQLAELRGKVEAFRQASGINIASFWNVRQASEAGSLYRFAETAGRSPDRTVEVLFRTAKQLEDVARRVVEVGGEIQKAAAAPEIPAAEAEAS